MKIMWLLLCVDSISNAWLVTAAASLHSVEESDRVVNGTGGEKSKATAVGELHVALHLSSRSIKLVIERFYVIPSSNNHTLCLTPFMQTGRNKSIHSMHDNATFKLDVEEACIPM